MEPEQGLPYIRAMNGRAIPARNRLREAAAAVAREHGCRLIVLFGSGARGEPTVRDLDLGILAEAPDLTGVTNAFIRHLGFQDVDVVNLQRADPLLAMLVARDGVILHEDPPGTFARFGSLAMRRYADTRKFREMERQEVEEFLARSGVPI